MSKNVISAYLATIGAKGGAAGKGTKARKSANKRAASASWTPEARATRAINLAKRKKLKAQASKKAALTNNRKKD